MRALLALFLLCAAALVAWFLAPTGVHTSAGRAPGRERAERRVVVSRGSGGEGEGEGDESAGAATGTATIEGIVTCADGTIWGMQIVATPQEEGLPRALTGSKPDGRYSLTVEAPATYELVLEADASRSLAGASREIALLLPGQRRRVDFFVDAGGVTRGIVTGPARPLLIVLPLASWKERGADVATLPWELRPLKLAAATPDAAGTFRYRALPEGEYALVVDDPHWTLRAPLFFSAGGPEVKVDLVPAYSIRLHAIDIESGEPLREFEVEVTGPNGKLWGKSEGRDGRVRSRLLLEDLPEGDSSALVSAQGYHPERLTPQELMRGEEIVQFFRPIRDTNTELLLRYPDGRIPAGDFLVLVFVPGRGNSSSFLARPDATGLLALGLPRGSGTVHLQRPHDAVLYASRVELPPESAGVVRLPVEVAPGGRLLLLFSGKNESAEVVILDSSAGVFFVDYPAGATERTLEDIAPGEYHLGDEEGRVVIIREGETTTLDLR